MNGTRLMGEGPRRRILVVDDHADTRDMLVRMLRKGGFDAEPAGGKAKALELCQQEHFDVMVADIGLADGSGLDLMREVSAARPIKGIACSGFGTEEHIAAAKAAGFSAYLQKPISYSALWETIERVLAGGPTVS